MSFRALSNFGRRRPISIRLGRKGEPPILCQRPTGKKQTRKDANRENSFPNFPEYFFVLASGYLAIPDHRENTLTPFQEFLLWEVFYWRIFWGRFFPTFLLEQFLPVFLGFFCRISFSGGWFQEQ